MRKTYGIESDKTKEIAEKEEKIIPLVTNKYVNTYMRAQIKPSIHLPPTSVHRYGKHICR